MPRIGSLSVQMKKTDKSLSDFIRAKIPYCVTCGGREELTAGHVFSRSFKSTRFSLDNVFTQCSQCNGDHERDRSRFDNWYKRTFGEEAFSGLETHSKTLRKWTVSELIQLEEDFKRMKENL